MSKFKVFNDPIYGLISFPFEIIYEIIDHRFFQRLRRISQVGLSNLVYPGATHTRFHHALGTAHLCSELILNLRLKNVDITDEEYESTCIAALLHDIGHGPYSHALEFQFLPLHHEIIGRSMIEIINEEHNGRLKISLNILNGSYKKKFLSQLLSSQLDVDRMDYLNRDSYYTGVAEGIIGYDRIIKMMNVVDDQLILEEKGIMSADKFFISRHLMYRQVYLHKAAISAEQMLMVFFESYKSATDNNDNLIIENRETELSRNIIEKFALLDDYDVMYILKKSQKSENPILRYLASGLINRHLFRTIIKKEPFTRDLLENLRLKTVKLLNISKADADKMVIVGIESNNYYDKNNELMIKSNKSNQLVPFSELSRIRLADDFEVMNYVSFPKELEI